MHKSEDNSSYAGWIDGFSRWSNGFFAVSVFALFVAVVLIPLAAFIPFFHNFDLSICMYWFDAGAIKSLATSVSLTGLVMAWFLHAVKDRECGQAMTEIIKHIFPWYHWNILVFFTSSAISIFFAGTNNLGGDVAVIPKETDIIISALALISTLLAIVNIARLCSVILFSFNKRRDAAFSCLYALVKKDDERMKHSALEKWQSEIRICIDNTEISHVEGFFRTLCEIKASSKTYFLYLTGVVQRIAPLSDSFYGKQVCSCIGKSNLSGPHKDEMRELILRLFIIALGDSLTQSRIIADELFESLRSIWDSLWGSQFPNGRSSETDKDFFCKCVLYYFAFLSIIIVNHFGNEMQANTDGSFYFSDSISSNKIIIDKLARFVGGFVSIRDTAERLCPKIFNGKVNEREKYLNEMIEAMSDIGNVKSKFNASEKYNYIFSLFWRG